MSPLQITQIWDDYYPKVYGYFYRRLDQRQDVEDLTSITLSIFVDKLESTPIVHQHAYLWRIAYLQLVHFIRDKSKQPVLLGIDEEFEAPDDEYDLRRSHNPDERLEKLFECVSRTLTGTDKMIVEEAVMHDKTAPDLALTLNLNPVAIRKRLSRALQKLRLHCKQLWFS